MVLVARRNPRHGQEKAHGARRDQGTSRCGVSGQSRISGAKRENRRTSGAQTRRAQAQELTPATDGCGENQRPQRRAAKPNTTGAKRRTLLADFPLEEDSKIALAQRSLLDMNDMPALGTQGVELIECGAVRAQLEPVEMDNLKLVPSHSYSNRDAAFVFNPQSARFG
jgi:hypothetical protein